MHRIWKGRDLKPHRLETFKFITDPQTEEHINDIVGLHLNPPTNAVVLSFDEEAEIKALERTQPLLRSGPGSRPARPTTITGPGSPAFMPLSK